MWLFLELCLSSTKTIVEMGFSRNCYPSKTPGEHGGDLAQIPNPALYLLLLVLQRQLV